MLQSDFGHVVTYGALPVSQTDANVKTVLEVCLFNAAF